MKTPDMSDLPDQSEYVADRVVQLTRSGMEQETAERLAQFEAKQRIGGTLNSREGSRLSRIYAQNIVLLSELPTPRAERAISMLLRRNKLLHEGMEWKIANRIADWEGARKQGYALFSNERALLDVFRRELNPVELKRADVEQDETLRQLLTKMADTSRRFMQQVTSIRLQNDMMPDDDAFKLTYFQEVQSQLRPLSYVEEQERSLIIGTRDKARALLGGGFPESWASQLVKLEAIRDAGVTLSDGQKILIADLREQWSTWPGKKL